MHFGFISVIFDPTKEEGVLSASSLSLVRVKHTQRYKVKKEEPSERCAGDAPEKRRKGKELNSLNQQAIDFSAPFTSSSTFSPSLLPFQ
jgi:hypothetical protein